jgi:CubicO group peptidase (beta-lactamase class C family)
MSACARDLANFGLMMINDGVLNGRPVVPGNWIADTVTGDGTSKECFSNGQYAYMDEGRKLVIVMLSSQPQPFDEALDLNTVAAMGRIGSWLEAT